MMGDKDESQKDLDWESRILCSDESCIGVIGPDGLCKECGKADESEPPEKDRETAVDAENMDEDEDKLDALNEEEVDSQTDIDWESRTLCSDESCIGVIGPDGRCRECGKMFENESPSA